MSHDQSNSSSAWVSGVSCLMRCVYLPHQRRWTLELAAMRSVSMQGRQHPRRHVNQMCDAVAVRQWGHTLEQCL